VILYTYCGPRRIDILESGRIMLTRARGFNDPFELNPHITGIKDNIEYGKHIIERTKNYVILSLADNRESLLIRSTTRPAMRGFSSGSTRISRSSRETRPIAIRAGRALALEAGETDVRRAIRASHGQRSRFLVQRVRGRQHRANALLQRVAEAKIRRQLEAWPRCLLKTSAEGNRRLTCSSRSFGAAVTFMQFVGALSSAVANRAARPQRKASSFFKRFAAAAGSK
jgi:hypothetical protein